MIMNIMDNYDNYNLDDDDDDDDDVFSSQNMTKIFTEAGLVSDTDDLKENWKLLKENWIQCDQDGAASGNGDLHFEILILLHDDDGNSYFWWWWFWRLVVIMTMMMMMIGEGEN